MQSIVKNNDSMINTNLVKRQWFNDKHKPLLKDNGLNDKHKPLLKDNDFRQAQSFSTRNVKAKK